jgi:hypothetical protein
MVTKFTATGHKNPEWGSGYELLFRHLLIKSISFRKIWEMKKKTLINWEILIFNQEKEKKIIGSNYFKYGAKIQDVRQKLFCIMFR